MKDVTRQFFVTHFRGCATLFNKHTFEEDLEVKAIRIHHWTEHTAMVGALQAVVSRARFRRTRRNGKSYSSMISSH